jgi:hypothetical protein
MLKVIAAFLFVALAYGAYVEVQNSDHTFRISLNAGSEVRWTKDGFNYRHLQELARYCTVPGTPVALGGIGNWQCEPYDTLANLNCTGVDGGLFFPVVKQVNGSFQCARELDTLAYLASTCTAGQTIKYINGAWQCASDMDTFRFLQSTCAAGTTLQYNGTNFVCVSGATFTDSDLLGSLGCSALQVARFNSQTNTFFCDADFNTIPSPCTAGQVVIYNGASWTCKNDEDYLSLVGIPGCGGSTPFLKYRNGQWTCVTDYFVLNIIGERGFLTYLQTANILQQTPDPVAITNYTILWGSIAQTTLFSTASPVFPFNGTITSAYVVMQNFQSTSGATIRVDFQVNGNQVTGVPITFSVAPQGAAATYNYLSNVFTGQTFQAGQPVSLGLTVVSGDLSTSPPLLSSIYVAVYISVTI